VTRMGIADVLGKPVSRDATARLLGRAPLPAELRSALGIINDTDNATFSVDEEDDPSLTIEE
jgi:hypothetical protein